MLARAEVLHSAIGWWREGAESAAISIRPYERSPPRSQHCLLAVPLLYPSRPRPVPVLHRLKEMAAVGVWERRKVREKGKKIRIQI
ncbi:hypothetical protein HKD37_19G054325 [Glycine soja]